MVVCMAVSKHFSLIATGNTNSIVCVYDLENAKLIHIHQASKEKNEKIVMLGFLEPFPILVCCTNEGYLNIWACKGAPLDQRYQLLGKFIN
jgi:WD40 repeat protein